MSRHLLRIDSSPRTDGRSRSRRLTSHFEHVWRSKHPAGRVTRRDVAQNPPPHVNQAWIEAAFTAEAERTSSMREALALSDALVDEFLGPDEYVFGVPMYNFGLPSALKAWIDNIVRVGRTFSFDPNDPDGRYYGPLVPAGRRATVLVTSGDAGYECGGPLWRLNQVEPYLRTVFEFVGITHAEFIYAGNDEFGGERLRQSLDRAVRRIETEAETELPVPTCCGD